MGTSLQVFSTLLLTHLTGVRLKRPSVQASNTDFKKGCGARLCCSCQDVSFLGVKGRSWQGLGGTKWSETIPVTRVSQDGQSFCGSERGVLSSEDSSWGLQDIPSVPPTLGRLFHVTGVMFSPELSCDRSV